MIRVILPIVLMTLSLCCQAQRQGICGRVVLEEGNAMPGPGQKREKPQGVVREIHFYEPVHRSDASMEDGLFTEVRGRLVATTMSDEKGRFRINLPPGDYSVFTKEENGLFANLFDGQGRINVVTVRRRKYTETLLKINYRAFY